MTDDDLDLTIPDFLRISEEDRKRARDNFVPTVRATTAEQSVDERQRELRAKHNADREAKRRASLAKHLEKHELETWNEKLGIWERDEAKIAAYNAKLLQEME